MSTVQGDITLLLQGIREGCPQSRSQFAVMVYDQLRVMAYRVNGDQAARHTLHPTALVNEMFVKLLDTQTLEKCPNRRYFFAAASRAMRQVLSDYARKKNCEKRGYGFARIALDSVLEYLHQQDIDTIALDEALDELERRDPRKAEIVHLRFFGGFTMNEIAEHCGWSLGTVELDWRAARAFLRLRLQ